MRIPAALFIASFGVVGAALAQGIGGGISNAPNYSATTWTPTITTDGTVGTPAYSVQVGSYEQIGRLIIARFDIQLSGWTGSPTGNVSVGGLPITSTATSNDFGYCFVPTYVTSASFASLSGVISPSATTAAIKAVAAAGGTGAGNVTAANLGTTGALFGACIYHN